jgi:basic amino acid/polyamine antiporter, APA family
MQNKSLFRKKPISLIMNDASKGLVEGEGIMLNKTLRVRDLTAFGVAAVVGAGIFSTIGTAAADGGPAVALLFIFTGFACAFSALCYAEFASIVPVSGSAYTYAYVAFGEIIAWIIGWDLLLEYAIGNVVVAISWSDYFTGLYNAVADKYSFSHMPQYLTMDYRSAYDGFQSARDSLAHGSMLTKLSPGLQDSYHAWHEAPRIASMPIIMDLPAIIIIAIITWLVYIGIKDSKNANNVMVVIKILVILLVIAVGAFYINTDNWIPFMPNGLSGVMKGASAVFFAYIGFDAISTTAEECKDPKRDLPRGIIYSLIICTILYVAVAFVLTGMTSYQDLRVGDPLSFVFGSKGITWMHAIVSVSAIVAMSSVLLVFQLGQPRIWMSMSRDGLLPKVFSRIHPVYKTPSFSTIITGIVVIVPTFFLKIDELTDLTSIGTLFAFVLVCGGILLMKNHPEMMSTDAAEIKSTTKRFKVPYVNGRYIIPGIFLVTVAIFLVYFPDSLKDFFSLQKDEIVSMKLPMAVFIISSIALTIATFIKKLSLIPILGLLSCLYIMTGLGITNWIRFVIWLVVGMVVYFSYSRKRSKLAKNG